MAAIDTIGTVAFMDPPDNGGYKQDRHYCDVLHDIANLILHALPYVINTPLGLFLGQFLSFRFLEAELVAAKRKSSIMRYQCMVSV